MARTKKAIGKTPQITQDKSNAEVVNEAEDRFKVSELKQIESLAGLGLTIPEIAAVMGVSRATMERRLKDNPDIREVHRRGKSLAKATVARVAYTLAASGKNHHMTKFWLQTQGGFSETSTVRLTGADGGPVELDVAALTPEERIERFRALAERLKLSEED